MEHVELPSQFGYSSGIPPLSEDTTFVSVAKNLEKADDLEELCGQILATLVVNRDRRTLQPEEQYRADWNSLLEGWSNRLAKIRGTLEVTPPNERCTMSYKEWRFANVCHYYSCARAAASHDLTPHAVPYLQERQLSQDELTEVFCDSYSY